MTGASDVLFVCTGNQCRSPMAEALLRAELAQRGVKLTVASAGLLSGGVGPPVEVLEVMAELGLDLSGHRSRQVDTGLVASSSLVATMTRQHLIEVAMAFPESSGRCFTLAELTGRAASRGRRRRDETVKAWAERMSAGRVTSSLLALPLADDIPDPIGRSRRVYESGRDLLAGLTATLAGYLAPA